MNFLLMMYMTMIIMGMMLGVTGSNWLIVWIGMETVFFGFMFLMHSIGPLSVSNSAVQYFLIQSFASILMLPVGYYFFYTTEQMMSVMELVLMILLFLKLGAFPLHFWVIPVIYGIHLLMTALLLGPLKVIPLIITCMFVNNSSTSYMLTIFMMIAMSSMLVGSFLGNLMTNYRAVIAASSITHTGWLLIGCMVMKVWQYFYCYYFILMLLIWSISSLNNINTTLSFVALSGLPPFLIFYAKISMISSTIFYNLFYGLLIVMVMSSIISLFYYMKYAFMFYLNISYLNFLNFQSFLFLIINGVGITLFLCLFFYGWAYALDF